MPEETRKNEIKPEDPRADAIKVPKQEGVQLLDSSGEFLAEIFPDLPAPEFNSGPVKAYRARTRPGGGIDCHALICEKHLIPRTMSLTSYVNIKSDILAPLIHGGHVLWPPVRQERFALLYAFPQVKRIHNEGEVAALGWKQDPTMELIVKPFVNTLREFMYARFFHGAIRPSNMFASFSNGKPDRVMLGDCLSVPPSYLQSALYEPIERALTDPVGRGMGSQADDLYSFGVSVAVIMRTVDPLQGKSEDDIIREKIEHGSYAAITGKDRFKGSILELLRGLLNDNPKERWTVEEVLSWLDGTRQSPKQSLKLKKASRHLAFHEKKYVYPSLLAMDLGSDLQETSRIVSSGDLNLWLERSLEDEEMAVRVEAAIRQAKEKGGVDYENRLASNLSIALDPMAPIRYKGARLMGDGIGTALAAAVILKQNIQGFADILMQGLGMEWINNSKNETLDAGALVTRFDQCRNFIRHGKTGFGIERCVYALCPESPCLSEKLGEYFVDSIPGMMLAFEDLCARGNAPVMFIDRHVAAFLSVRDSRVIDPYLFEIASAEEHKKILGNLKCLAAMQKRYNLPPAPGVAKVFLDAIPAVCARYHDRETRRKLESAARKFAAAGDLLRMSSLFSNVELIDADTNGFREAMQEYASLVRERERLTQRLQDKSSFGRSTGKEFAAIVSCIISAIFILISAFLFLAGEIEF